MKNNSADEINETKAPKDDVDLFVDSIRASLYLLPPHSVRRLTIQILQILHEECALSRAQA